MLEEFIAELFGIAHEVRALRARHDALAPLYSVKRLFVQRRAAKKFGPDQAAGFDGPALRRELEPLLGGELTELRFAERVDAWMKAEADNAASLDLAARYAAWATHTPQGQELHKAGILFKLPHKVDPHHLVPVETEVVDGVTMLKLPRAHRRAARRLRADRSRHRSHRRARSCQLLHLVPQPGQGFLLEGAQGEERRVQEERRSAWRSPAARSTRRSPR